MEDWKAQQNIKMVTLPMEDFIPNPTKKKKKQSSDSICQVSKTSSAG